MEQAVKSNSVEKFKAIMSTAHTSPIFQIVFKKNISQKIQETWAWESGSNILQALTYYGFSRSLCYDGTRY